MKKRVLFGFIAAALALSFAGCGSSEVQEMDEEKRAELSAIIEEKESEMQEIMEDPDASIEDLQELSQEEADALTSVLPDDYVVYEFRNDKLLNQHFEKHGEEMGFDSPEEYEEAACAVINDPEALTKTEEEDGDFVYYLEDTNEFVILSTDGYIRTYFCPSGGKAYFERQ